MINTLLVGSGAAIGAMLRFALNNYFEPQTKRLPRSTFFINLTGSLLLGFFFGLHLMDPVYLFLGTGIMGGYTTFSTYNFELFVLWKKDRPMFYRYFFGSYGLGLLLSFIGIVIGAKI
ncbi:fluoride efflux transporter FluC [Enterococcus raffinosus]|uniref:Fluoride-specific ion channel FluC n=1 Tax=Enterococcus raffinosus TaxID=71452 RepID=A0AAW8T3C5_9ENTE|nr:CrcB family protein [Enterococcus raffinosus]MDT2521925.1 CrcB family protein [Enterococcus raffinosus]MDT2528270.1 CrcB family protein [Enterococcus raffinosus]MDT2533265.1 CrcB family protein [Enterococcus raffinosus]MDT2543706.1 CrcB family protein [Enterococcus raffinosus]MDT2553819.1 CrcB family protein [Enterococcus raffinosus]